MSKQEFEKGERVEFVDYGDGLICADLTVGKVYVLTEDDLIDDDKGDTRRVSRGVFKLAVRNQMPKLEAGMIVKYLDKLNGVEVCFGLMIDDANAVRVDGDKFARNMDTRSDVIAVYRCPKHTPFKNIVKRLGEPIWKRNDNSEEQEKLAELKKTIADAQKQADGLEEAMNGRR